MCSFTKYIGITIAAISLAVPACAQPSLNGPTGTGNLPTAEIAPQGLATTALTFQDTSSATAKSWRGTYGIGERMEMSASYVETSRDTKGIAAKYLVSNNQAGKTSLGVLYASTSAFAVAAPPEEVLTLQMTRTVMPVGGTPPATLVNRVNTYQIYAVQTRQIVPEGTGLCGLAGSIGVNWTDMSFTDGAFRAFASLEARRGASSLAVDYQTRNHNMESQCMSSIVARHTFKDGFAAEAGWSNTMGVLGSSNSRFFGGVNYSFGIK